MSDLSHLDRLRHDVRLFFVIFLFGSVGWMILLSISYSCQGGHFLKTLGTLGLFSAAAMISGALLGFLFGIPRVFASSAAAVAQQQSPSSVQPNTNLEQISDWLTKVLVGVGLTQITSIYKGIGDFSGNLNALLLGTPQDGPISVATIIAFSVAGFLWIYFECRTSIFALFDADPAAPPVPVPPPAPVVDPAAPPVPVPVPSPAPVTDPAAPPVPVPPPAPVADPAASPVPAPPPPVDASGLDPVTRSTR